MTVLVAGPSSVGKSSYIARNRSGAGVVMFAWQFPVDELPPNVDFVHFNLLSDAAVKGDAHNSGEAPWTDPSLITICNQVCVDKAVVLVARKATLMERMQSRTAIEPLLDPEVQAPYPARLMAERLVTIDLAGLYDSLFNVLYKRGIPTQCLASDPSLVGYEAAPYEPIERSVIRGLLSAAI